MASWREEAAAQARADGEPPGLISHPPVPPGIRAYIWSEEKAATHSTAKPNEHGVFAEPVYFDWDRDWGRVRGLLRQPALRPRRSYGLLRRTVRAPPQLPVVPHVAPPPRQWRAGETKLLWDVLV